MSYLIVVTVDCNDADCISLTYIEEDITNVNQIIEWFKVFYDVYANTWPYKNMPSYKAKHSTMLTELGDCLYALAGNKVTIINKEFLSFVETHKQEAELVMDWINYHWPQVNNDIGSCHTLESIEAYELQNINPVTIYSNKH